MNRDAKIGLFVLFALATVLYFVLQTRDVKDNFFGKGEPRRIVQVALEDATGVRKDTDVRIAGVKVGKVVNIRLEEGLAIADISIPETMVLKDGAFAKLTDQGVLGDRYISLNLGLGKSLAEQNRLEGKAPPTLGDLTSTINDLAENMKIITQNLKDSMVNQQGDNRIEVIAANIEKLTSALVSVMEENRRNFSTASGNMVSVTESLKSDIPGLVSEMKALATELRGMASGNRGNVDATMTQVSELSANMKDVSSSLSSIARKVDEGEGTLGKLVNEGETVDRLNDLLASAQESLGDVKNLLKKADDIQFRLNYHSEYLVGNEALKNYFGFRIQPNPEKYYLIEGVTRDLDYLPTAYNEVVEEVYDADGNLLQTTVTKSEEEEDDLLINGVLAYKFGDFFLKAGLFESTGGAGFDYMAMESKLQFSLEAFDFSRDHDLSPYGRANINYRFTENIHFQVGVDDFLETDYTSAALGAGLRWKDEDLKLLLTKVGSFF